MDSHQIDPRAGLESLTAEVPKRSRRELLSILKGYQPGENFWGLFKQSTLLLPPGILPSLILAKQRGAEKTLYHSLLSREPSSAQIQFLENPQKISRLGKFLLFLLLTSFIIIRVLPDLKATRDDFSLGSLPLRSLPLGFAGGWLDRLIAMLDHFALPVIVGMTGLIILYLIYRGGVFASFFGSFRLGSLPIPKKVIQRRALSLLVLTGESLQQSLLEIEESENLKKVFPKIIKTKTMVRQGVDSWSALQKGGILTRQEAQQLPSCSPAAQAWLLQWNANQILAKRSNAIGMRSLTADGLCNLVILMITTGFCLIIVLTLIEIMEELLKS